VRRGKMPGHVGLILDRNRRFAEEKGWNSVDGHQKGADKIDEVLQRLILTKAEEGKDPTRLSPLRSTQRR